MISTRVTGVILACLCASSSCTGSESAGPPLPLPDVVTEADLIGDWEFSRSPAPGCVGAAGAATYYFTADDAGVVESSTAVNVVEEWDVEKPPRFNWAVIGNFHRRTGATTLNFWHTPLSIGAEFTGTINAAGIVTGTLRDPKPGYEPHFVIGSCTFQMTGRRVAP